MEDIRGIEIKVGQTVATMDTSYRTKGLKIWKVYGFTPKQVRLERFYGKDNGYRDYRTQYPDQIAIVEDV